MFIRYQNVRNTVLGIATLGVAGLAFFLWGGGQREKTPPPPAPALLARQQTPDAESPSRASSPPTAEFHETEFPNAPSPAAVAERTGNSSDDPRIADTPIPPPAEVHKSSPPEQALSPQEMRLARYRSAMKVATGQSDPSGKGKDVLGPQSPWKLNLYDDDQDGQWDRGKLDYERDAVDDEHWTYKKGRWEKDGGSVIWDGADWIAGATLADQTAPDSKTTNRADPQLARYQAAMKIATSRADPSGKGKDVLGPRSPWKLNLYDDDKDGKWDRGKLDYDRDEVDDEKWNFKYGRWEKNGGEMIWDGSQWIPSAKND